MDHAVEIQANAAEVLANMFASFSDVLSARVHALGVGPLLLLCASNNVHVQRHAGLIVGNLAQSAAQREAIGQRGGVEALFLTLRHSDPATCANSLWALGNLSWAPSNQERIGRFFPSLMQLCEPSSAPAVRSYAVALLANALAWNDRNRLCRFPSRTL